MSAKRQFEIKVTRSGMAPALLADPGRVDHVEVIEVASGEVIFFWDVAPREATKLARMLRADLQRLPGTGFVAKWEEFHVV